MDTARDEFEHVACRTISQESDSSIVNIMQLLHVRCSWILRPHGAPKHEIVPLNITELWLSGHATAQHAQEVFEPPRHALFLLSASALSFLQCALLLSRMRRRRRKCHCSVPRQWFVTLLLHLMCKALGFNVPLLLNVGVIVR